MKHIFTLLLVLLSFTPLRAMSISEYPTDSLWTLDSIPSWIRQHINFPEEACQYGVAGVEKFVISAAWDGRVFITSEINALNPAFEKEIERVVSQAPPCEFVGVGASDIYKVVEIDFSCYVPDKWKEQIRSVGKHTAPLYVPKQKGAWKILKSKAPFYAMLSSKCSIPDRIQLKSYIDTVTFNYVITEQGKIEQVNVTRCKNERLKYALEKAIKRSPKWQPALTENKKPIAVPISESVKVSLDPSGRKVSLAICYDEVRRNSTIAPTDTNRLVLNPEMPPQYKSTAYKKINNAIKDRLSEAKSAAEYAGIFIVERDGTISHMEVEATDEQADSIITELVKASEWIPAQQGAQPVRTVYSFIGKNTLHSKYEYKYVYEPMEGGLEYERQLRSYVLRTNPGMSYEEYELLKGTQKERLMQRGFPTFPSKFRIVRVKIEETVVPSVRN